MKELPGKPFEGKIEKEPQLTTRVLLVEDNPEYQKVAIEALKTAGLEDKVVVEVAKDYDEFEELIGNEEKKFDIVVSDLLFPKKTGTHDRTLGIEVTKKIKEVLDSSEDEDYQDVHSASRDLENLEDAVKGKNYRIQRTYLMPKEAEREGRVIKDSGYEKVIRSTEADQPLGVLVVEKAKELGLPYVIVTSGHGAHGDITTPIAFYLKIKGLIPYYRSTSVEEKLRTEEEAIQELQVKHPQKSKEELLEMYRKYYEGNPFFADIDKINPEIWENILRRADFYVEQERKKINNK